MVVLTVSLGLDLQQLSLHQLVEQLGQLAGVDLVAESAGRGWVDDRQGAA